MSQRLATYVGKRVSVTEVDGRLIVGKLRGVDQFTNIVLDNAELRSLGPGQEPQAVPLGSTVIRGDDVCMIGLVDTIAEAAIATAAVKKDEQ